MSRRVEFSHLFNFRDLGGYPAAGGRVVAWGRLYRSDNLGWLREHDHDRFAALGVRTVIDLRRAEEILANGRVPPLPGVDYRWADVAYLDWPSLEVVDRDTFTTYLVERYLDMAQTGRVGIATALGLIADAGTAPLVFHCHSGKDRTGIVAALTLALLGVDDATIAEDYALSHEAVVRYRATTNLDPFPVSMVPAAAMLGLLAGLREQHGSIETYVKSLGVTEEQIEALTGHLLT